MVKDVRGYLTKRHFERDVDTTVLENRREVEAGLPVTGTRAWAVGSEGFDNDESIVVVVTCS